MKLYLIWQEKNNGYDTYDSAVVCAKNVEDARSIYPCKWSDEVLRVNKKFADWDWVRDIKHVNVTFLGNADKSVKYGVVCSSFNAG